MLTRRWGELVALLAHRLLPGSREGESRLTPSPKRLELARYPLPGTTDVRRNKWGGLVPEVQAGRVFDERVPRNLSQRIDQELAKGHGGTPER